MQKSDPEIKPGDLEIPNLPSDYPADSFYLSREDELEWFDQYAFYDRNESTKGNSNSAPPHRFSVTLKSKPAIIISLPKRHKKRGGCKHVKTTELFPKRSTRSGRTSLPLSEPGSPKVSCIGRVRSKKERSRRNRLYRQKKKTTTEKVGEPVVRTGFWKRVKAAFGIGQRKMRAVVVERPSGSGKKNSAEKTKCSVAEPVVEVVGLSELKRFKSGHRCESWGGWDIDSEVSDHPVHV